MRIKIIYTDDKKEIIHAVDTEWKEYVFIIHATGCDIIIPWSAIRRVEEEI